MNEASEGPVVREKHIDQVVLPVTVPGRDRKARRNCTLLSVDMETRLGLAEASAAAPAGMATTTVPVVVMPLTATL